MSGNTKKLVLFDDMVAFLAQELEVPLRIFWPDIFLFEKGLGNIFSWNTCYDWNPENKSDFDIWLKAENPRTYLKRLAELEAFSVMLKTDLGTEGTLNVPGFGIFHSVTTPGRSGKNPQTEETIKIPVRQGILFYPHAGFLAAIHATSLTKPLAQSILQADKALQAFIAAAS